MGRSDRSGRGRDDLAAQLARYLREEPEGDAPRIVRYVEAFSDRIPEAARLAVADAPERDRAPALLLCLSAMGDKGVPLEHRERHLAAVRTEWTRVLALGELSPERRESIEVALETMEAELAADRADAGDGDEFDDGEDDGYDDGFEDGDDDGAGLRRGWREDAGLPGDDRRTADGRALPPRALSPDSNPREYLDNLMAMGLVPVPGASRVIAPPDVLEAGIDAAIAALDEEPHSGSALVAVAAAAALECADEMEPRYLASCVAALGTCTSPRAAWHLEELARWPGAGAVAAAVRESARLHANAGVKPAAPAFANFVRATATGPGWNRARALGVVVEQADGARAQLAVILSAALGIRIAEFTVGEEHPLVRLLAGRPGGPAPAGPEFVRSLAGEALHAHRASGIPVPAEFMLLRSLLGAEPLEERPHRPAVPARPDTAGGPRAWAKGTGDLSKSTPWNAVRIASDAAWAFVHAARQRERLSPMRPLRVTPLLLTAFHRNVLPGERDALVRWLDDLLEIETLAGRTAGRPMRLAAQVRWLLADGTIPMHDIPWIGVLAREALRLIDAFIMDGHHDPLAADRVLLEESGEAAEGLALEPGEAMDDLEDDDPDDGDRDDHGPPERE